MLFNMTKLDRDSTDFINYLISHNKASCPVTETAIAWAIAKKLTLPTTAVENIDSYFKMTNLLVVMAKISKLNEFVILNTENITDLVRKFYITRYYTLNPPDLCWCPDPETAVYEFLGLAMGLDTKTIEVIKSNPVQLSKIHNSAIKFFNSVIAAEE